MSEESALEPERREHFEVQKSLNDISRVCTSILRHLEDTEALPSELQKKVEHIKQSLTLLFNDRIPLILCLGHGDTTEWLDHYRQLVTTTGHLCVSADHILWGMYQENDPVFRATTRMVNILIEDITKISAVVLEDRRRTLHCNIDASSLVDLKKMDEMVHLSAVKTVLYGVTSLDPAYEVVPSLKNNVPVLQDCIFKMRDNLGNVAQQFRLLTDAIEPPEAASTERVSVGIVMKSALTYGHTGNDDEDESVDISILREVQRLFTAIEEKRIIVENDSDGIMILTSPGDEIVAESLITLLDYGESLTFLPRDLNIPDVTACARDVFLCIRSMERMSRQLLIASGEEKLIRQMRVSDALSQCTVAYEKSQIALNVLRARLDKLKNPDSRISTIRTLADEIEQKAAVYMDSITRLSHVPILPQYVTEQQREHVSLNTPGQFREAFQSVSDVALDISVLIKRAVLLLRQYQLVHPSEKEHTDAAINAVRNMATLHKGMDTHIRHMLSELGYILKEGRRDVI